MYIIIMAFSIVKMWKKVFMNIENSGISNSFKQLAIRYDESHEVLWTCFNQKNIIPCFNNELIKELTQHQIEIQNTGGVLYDGEKAHHINIRLRHLLHLTCLI